MQHRPKRQARAYMAALCLTSLLISCKEKPQAPEPGPPEVEVTRVTQRNVPISQEGAAQLNGRYNAVITSRVQGYLLRQNYRDGLFVKKGQLLSEIDPHAFEAAIAQAKAQVA